MARKDWDQYFMDIAKMVATRATCPRASVGAIIVKNRRILTTGYNGAPTSMPECHDIGCILKNNSCQRVVHAEQNAIIQAALHGVSTAGATLYVTHQPCLDCAKMLINASIVRVVYGSEYPDDLARQFLEAAGIALERAT